MSKFSELFDLMDSKTKALDSATKVIETFMEECQEGNCDLTTNPPYHWRGCEVTLKPLLDNLKAINKES